jgi:hypothetical protein
VGDEAAGSVANAGSTCGLRNATTKDAVIRYRGSGRPRPHIRGEYVDGWNAVMRPVGMTAADLTELRKIIAGGG